MVTHISKIEINAIVHCKVFPILRPIGYWEDLDVKPKFHENILVTFVNKDQSINGLYSHQVVINSIETARKYGIDNIYRYFKEVCSYYRGDWIAYWFISTP